NVGLGNGALTDLTAWAKSLSRAVPHTQSVQAILPTRRRFCLTAKVAKTQPGGRPPRHARAQMLPQVSRPIQFVVRRIMRLRILALIAIVFCTIAAPAMAADLVLKRVMLSTGGVGYFEYEAEVSGDAALTLEVPLSQVDDILKSIVVYDSSGGGGRAGPPRAHPPPPPLS